VQDDDGISQCIKVRLPDSGLRNDVLRLSHATAFLVQADM
jgi:hypothetical protein